MMEKQAKVVYRNFCSCGEVYIGETVSRLETRVKEHRDACQKGAVEKSAPVEHAWKNSIRSSGRKSPWLTGQDCQGAASE